MPATLPADGFLMDPKAMRPRRLRQMFATAAREVGDCLAAMARYHGRPTHRALFVTLTYAANTRGNPNDVRGMFKRVREWLRRQGEPMCPYVWVAELQKRGALHYHILLWLPRRLRLPKLDRRGWWPHGMTQVQTARNPVGYLVKYASKFESKDVKRLRKGTRMHGRGGLPPQVREAVRRALLTRWARRAMDAVTDAEYAEAIEREMEEQERADEAFLRDAFPGDYPPEPEDPNAPPSWVIEEQERAALYEQEAEEQRVWAILDRLRKRGGSRFARCVGGYVDRLTGALLPTPWRVEFSHGCVTVWPKEATC